MRALAEVFSILTGGRDGQRPCPADASQLVHDSVLPLVRVVSLSGSQVLAALSECEARSGAVHDLLHLIAARRSGAERALTLDPRDFQALARPRDPRTQAP